MATSFLLFLYLLCRKTKSLRGSFGPDSHTNWMLNSPMKATSSPSNWASRTTQPRKSQAANLAGEFLQSFQRAIRFDMHRAQPRNVRIGQHERARKERTKTDGAHECRQIRTQLLTNETGRREFGLGRFIFPRLISNETLGEIPHLGSGPAHLVTRPAWGIFP